MHDKVCLITGATNGIGLVAARELARQGARVVLVGRSAAKCAAVVDKIRVQTGSTAEALIADLSSQRQIRELARQFRERYQRLDVLVNNAGAIHFHRQQTEDGLEMTFALNHLAYFLLTQLLLDTLRASAAARVVNVSSSAHWRGTLDFADLQAERGYSGWAQYCRSKLMNLLFTFELARRLAGSGVTANALHPGFVATGFGSNTGWKGTLLRAAATFLAIGPEKGARTIIYLASAPEAAGVTGHYFVRERQASSSAASLDEAAAKRLWQLSEQLTGNLSEAR